MRKIACSILAALAVVFLGRADEFDPAAFRTPPAACRPECWFGLKGGCLDPSALSRELEALKAGGFGGVQSMQFGGSSYCVPNDIPYLSDGWHAFMRRMGDECRRLGLSYTMLACPGWSMFGGPWVPADRQMRELVFATASGEGRVAVPRPAKADDKPARDYRDIRLLAFPTPRGADETLPAPTAARGTPAAPKGTIPHAWVAYNDRPRAASPAPFSSEASDAAWLKVFSDDPAPIDFPKPGRETCTVSYPRAVTVRTLEIPSPQLFDHMWCYEPDLLVTLEAETDGAWREIGRWTLPPSCWQDAHPMSLACDETTAARFRFSFTHGHPARLHYVRLRPQARLTDYEGRAGHALRGVFRNLPEPRTDPAALVDASRILFPAAERGADGALVATLPAGRWTVLRVGSVASLIRNHPAPDDATGWECDKLSSAGADAHWDGFIEPLVRKGGDLADGRLNGLLLDSWECEAQTWTEGLDAAFRAARGYPVDPWYPALAGFLVGSRERTAKFLLDWRQLLSDRVRDEFFGRIAERAHARGIRLYVETAGGDVYPGDILDFWRPSDVPMCEFWYPRTDLFVGSLAFKPLRPCVSAAHVYGKPGVAAESLTETKDRSKETPADWLPVLNAALARGVTRIVFNGFTHNLKRARTGHDGIDFEAHPDWWPPLTAYLARCRYALELGTSVRDVLLDLGGDLDHRPPQDLPFPEGYDYDYVNADALRSHVKERDGVWRGTDGTTWRLKVGRDTPKDEIAAELRRRGVAPDLLFAKTAGDDTLLWIHRRTEKGDVYFVCADYGRPLAGEVSVRAAGKTAFVADPMTGETKPLSVHRTADGRTAFRLDLPASAARFVVLFP